MKLTPYLQDRIHRFVHALEQRLRTTRGIATRFPLHQDPSFRSKHMETCTFQELTNRANTENRTIGGARAPNDHYVVITHRAIAMEYWLDPATARGSSLRMLVNNVDTPIVAGHGAERDETHPGFVDIGPVAIINDTSFKENATTHVYLMTGWNYYRRANDPTEPGDTRRRGWTGGGWWWTPVRHVLYAGDSIEFRTDNADLATEPRVVQTNLRGWTTPARREIQGREGMVS